MEYHLGHIPGARLVERSDYEAEPETQAGITGNLIDEAGFSKLAQKLGISRDSRIVIYDRHCDATRLWWALFYYGKADARILDGGIAAWKSAGYPTDILAGADPTPGSLTAAVSVPSLRVETDTILALRSGTSGQLWDTRGTKEYCGAELKRGAHRPGRIPWGRHSEWTLFKLEENPTEWLPAAEVQIVLDRLGFDRNRDQYFFCQSGVRSTQALFTLYLAGWPVEKLHNYDSSWIGWSKDTRLPVELGCEPERVAAN
jgi:thiosulfate/3-mercaptopyruvate sulfurtransferase